MNYKLFVQDPLGDYCLECSSEKELIDEFNDTVEEVYRVSSLDEGQFGSVEGYTEDGYLVSAFEQ